MDIDIFDPWNICHKFDTLHFFTFGELQKQLFKKLLTKEEVEYQRFFVSENHDSSNNWSIYKRENKIFLLDGYGGRYDVLGYTKEGCFNVSSTYQIFSIIKELSKYDWITVL